MIILKDFNPVNSYINQAKRAGLAIGFIPTMGALHKGHIALIEQAREACGLVVCSIFVNPTQFNDAKDYQKYPVSLEQDIYQLEKAGANLLFLPSSDSLYPGGIGHLEQYELGYLETVLEGAYRPGHFQGVCQVMSRLLNIVQPTLLFMGQKDYQQCLVIKRLMQMLQLPAELVSCPTIRELDGLAMSSRNKRLGDMQRQRAIGIFRTLIFLKENIHKGNIEPLKKKAMTLLEEYNFKTDYIEIANADTLELISDWNGQQKLVALIAAFQEEIRLIDNMLIAP